MKIKICAAAFALLTAAIVPQAAIAYVGPGAGISLIGATIGLLVALGTAIGFVIVWPLRTLFRHRSRASVTAEGERGADGRERP